MSLYQRYSIGISNGDKRLLIGHSLGGWNAIQLAIHDETRDLFDRCSALDPMMPLPSFKSGNPGDWAIANIWRGGPIFGAESQLEEEFYHRLNPITGNAHKFSDTLMPMQIQAAHGSAWKFYVKHAELAYIARVNGCKNLSVIGHEGGHSFFMYDKLGDFLAS